MLSILLLLGCGDEVPDRATEVRDVCSWEKHPIEDAMVEELDLLALDPTADISDACLEEIDRDFGFDSSMPALPMRALITGVHAMLILDAEGDTDWIPNVNSTSDVGAAAYNYIADRVDLVVAAECEVSEDCDARASDGTIFLDNQIGFGGIFMSSVLVHETRHLDDKRHSHVPCDWDETQSCDRSGSLGAYGLQNAYIEELIPNTEDEGMEGCLQDWADWTAERM